MTVSDVASRQRTLDGTDTYTVGLTVSGKTESNTVRVEHHPRVQLSASDRENRLQTIYTLVMLPDLLTGSTRDRVLPSALSRSINLSIDFNRFGHDIVCMADRRRHPRNRYVARTEVSWIDGGRQLTMPGMIEDKSVSGLAIHISKSIPVGTAVTVNFAHRKVPAVVQRCMKDGLGTLIGISFEQDKTAP